MLRLLSSGRAGLLASSANGGASVSPAAALARRRLQQGANAGIGQTRLITRFPEKQGTFSRVWVDRIVHVPFSRRWVECDAPC